MTDFYTLNPDQQAACYTLLAREALKLWGIEQASLDLLKHRENAVYGVTTENGTRYVMRVHRYNYHSDAELRSEFQWMTALNEYGVHTPAVIPAQSGELFRVVSVDGVPEARQCDLFGWVDGVPLGSIEEGVEGDTHTLANSYRIIGELAAKVHKHAIGWQLPEGFTRHHWDVDGLVGENPFWGRFWELQALTSEQRNLILNARELVRGQLIEFGRGNDRYSLIHADFLPENLMVSGDDINLIDFDDSGFGWHLFELATSLFFQLGQDHFDVVFNAMVEGYRKERKLPGSHLEMMPVFFMARAFTYLGWVHTRSETETAQEVTPLIVEGACELAEALLGA